MDEHGKHHTDPPSLQKFASNNIRPITCLPIMWKILKAQIRLEIYNSLMRCGLFLEELKGCRK